MSRTSAFDQILSGAAWLDEIKPEWFTIIDTDELQMADPTQCVLGQVFKKEAAGAGELSGFEFVWEMYSAEFLNEHGFLFHSHESWMQQINARLIGAGLEKVSMGGE